MNSTSNESRLASTGWRRWLARAQRYLRSGLGFFIQLALVAWAVLAIHYSDLPWTWLRDLLAVIFATFSGYALWFKPTVRTRLAFAGLFILVLIWEISIDPSNDRPWRPEVAVLPRAFVEGDQVRITGVRDFSYRSEHDFTVHYVERMVSLQHLTSVDFFISYWTIGPIAHTFLSFNFDNAQPVSISIEIRPVVGEAFSAIGSLFKHFELIYVVGEERDLVRVRTNYRGEEVYLYRIQATPAAARRLFEIYLTRINSLADHPEWYHLLKSNCTLNIVRYAYAAGDQEGSFDIRHFLNGWTDRSLYEKKLVIASIPFDSLRSRSRINEAAQATPDVSGPGDFARAIRASLPGAPPRRD